MRGEREGCTDGCVRPAIRQRTGEEQIVYTVGWGKAKLSMGTVVSVMKAEISSFDPKVDSESLYCIEQGKW